MLLQHTVVNYYKCAQLNILYAVVQHYKSIQLHILKLQYSTTKVYSSTYNLFQSALKKYETQVNLCCITEFQIYTLQYTISCSTALHNYTTKDTACIYLFIQVSEARVTKTAGIPHPGAAADTGAPATKAAPFSRNSQAVACQRSCSPPRGLNHLMLQYSSLKIYNSKYYFLQQGYSISKVREKRSTSKSGFLFDDM